MQFLTNLLWGPFQANLKHISTHRQKSDKFDTSFTHWFNELSKVAFALKWFSSWFPVVLMIATEIPWDYSVLVCGIFWCSFWALSSSLSTVLVTVRYACILLWPLIGERIFFLSLFLLIFPLEVENVGMGQFVPDSNLLILK